MAIAALGTGLAFVHHPGVAVPYPAPDAGLVALILLGCLPLDVRRRWPVPVLVAALTATVAVTLLGWNAEWPGLASYVALYTTLDKPLVLRRLSRKRADAPAEGAGSRCPRGLRVIGVAVRR